MNRILKTNVQPMLVLVCFFLSLNLPLRAEPMGTAFSYQGRLNSGGNPAMGTYDLRFAIYDASGDGTSVAGPITITAVAVSNGLFTVTLDFRTGVFTGDARWLAIAVRPAGIGDFTPLLPRQLLTPLPYALYAPSAGAAASATTAATVSGSVPASQISGRLTDGQVSTNVALLSTGPTFAGTVGASYLNSQWGLRWGEVANLTTDQGGSIVLGDARLTNTTPYLDFHYGVASNYPYHSIRLINNAPGQLEVDTWGFGPLMGLNRTNIWLRATNISFRSPDWEPTMDVENRSVVIDPWSRNAGEMTPGVRFGWSGSGEGIASKRSAGGNQYGLDFYTAAQPRMSIASDGDVGIGTTAPRGKLEVTGNPRVDNTEGPQLRLTGGGSGGALSVLDLATYDPGSNAPSARIQATDNVFSSDVDILTKIPGANENPLVSRLHIAASGDVGIGTTTPAAKLDVAGTVRATAMEVGSVPVLSGLVQASNLAPGSVVLKLNGLTDNVTVAAGTNVTLATEGNTLRISATPGSVVTNAGWGLSGNAGTTAENFLGTTDGQSLQLRVNNQVRMQLDQSGNVGIGTVTPGARLDVASVAGRQLSAGTWADVSGSANGVGLLGGNMYQDFWPPAFKYATTHDGIGAVGFAANYPWNQASVIASGTSSSTAGEAFTPSIVATFTTGGNVGIGTPSPSTRLDVVGTVKATQLQVGEGHTLSGTLASIAGGQQNSAMGNFSALVGGAMNTVSGRYALVGGGYANSASAAGAVVGGGGNDGSSIGGNTNAGKVSFIGGGMNNTIASSAHSASIAGGNWGRVSGPGGTIGGGLNNTSSNNFSTVAGGEGNLASGEFSAVGGGSRNRATGIAATVAGGYSNTAAERQAAVGGGAYNRASENATVAGGYNNLASELYATIGGGIDNFASGFGSMIGGGRANTASGFDSTVPGGAGNVAQGRSSFAAGYRAHALHDGTFVWGDSLNADISSTASNQFVVRASGGVRLFCGMAGTVIEGDVGIGGQLGADRLFARDGAWIDGETTINDDLTVDGAVAIVGGLVVYGGKWAAVETSQGRRGMHAEESAQAWFTDYGFGRLEQGRALIKIDPLFAETVNLEKPYHVFVQLNDTECEGVAVVGKTATEFEVRERKNGTSSAEFSYRLVALRKGFEDFRMDRVPYQQSQRESGIRTQSAK